MTQKPNIESIVKKHYGKMLAALIYQFKDISLAEDVLQSAIVKAVESWQIPPQNPVAWLLHVAKNIALDKLRRDANYQNKLSELSGDDHDDVNENTNEQDETIPDERLRLIFTCCHPALKQSAQVALTLKTLCGLSSKQIANAFLISQTTVEQRLVRAKNKIKTAKIAYQIPSKNQWQERLSSVTAVIYLIFNEGYYSQSEARSIQPEMCHQALDIATVLLHLLPDEAEVIGLLSLMNFHMSRFPARINKRGEAVSLREQNRDLWLKDKIILADKLLIAAVMKSKMGAYQIQAAISGVHAHATNFEATDWNQITLLYYKLKTYQTSPIVDLNLAVSLSYSESLTVGLLKLDELETQKIMQNYQPWFAAKADMLARNGQAEIAAECYKKAIKLTKNQSDKAYLLKQLRQVG